MRFAETCWDWFRTFGIWGRKAGVVVRLGFRSLAVVATALRDDTYLSVGLKARFIVQHHLRAFVSVCRYVRTSQQPKSSEYVDLAWV